MAKTLKTSKRAVKKRAAAPKKAAKKVARKQNSYENACGYCGGPGGIFKGPGHAVECSRYVKPKRRVKTIGRKRNSSAKPNAAKKKAVKRKRNLDHRDSDHPIEVTKHFRSGPPGYLTPWQRAHHAGQGGLFDHGIAPAKIRARKNAAKKRATKKRNPDLQAESVRNRKDFAGHFNGFTNVYAPTGTPDGLSRLGILAELVLVDGSKLAMRKQNTVFLAQDTKHKLHVVSSQAGRLIDNEPGNYGQVRKVEYIEAKPHLGEKQPIQWVHKLGEISGIRPELVITKDGQLRFVGGDYTINWRGIIN